MHAAVRSRPGDPVAYNAFDPELQLWVAACLYKGLEDVHRLFGPTVDDRYLAEVLYPHATRLGTTLQVSEEMWPPDRAAFEAYWKDGVERIEMDDVSRTYLRASPTSASSSRRSARSADRSAGSSDPPASS